MTSFTPRAAKEFKNFLVAKHCRPALNVDERSWGNQNDLEHGTDDVNAGTHPGFEQGATRSINSSATDER